MPDKVFVDTILTVLVFVNDGSAYSLWEHETFDKMENSKYNIFIYGAMEQMEDNKHKRALELLCNEHLEIVISTQIVNEFYSVLLRNDFEESLIRNKAEEMLNSCLVSLITLETIRKAWQLRDKYSFSYWDSLVVASALQNGCSILYSEDLHTGLKPLNQLEIVNPLMG